jgi:SAM-dependent methyltransferase
MKCAGAWAMRSHDTTLDKNLQEEAAFADAEYRAQYAGPDANPVMFRKYQHPTRMWDWRERAARLMGELDGRRLLDYGCGQGEEAIYFAKLGARVTAIDVSPVGVELTGRRAAHNAVADRVDARVMNAVPTEFPAESFDVVHGHGILHHVGIGQGLAEVHRLLKPGGLGIFLEPLGSSRVVEACKRFLHKPLGRRLNLIPVTSGEENLKLRDVRDACRVFAAADIYPYRLTYRLRKLFIPARLHDASLILDYWVLRACPPLSHFAGAAVIHVRK